MWVKFYNTPMNEDPQTVYVDISKVTYIQENIQDDFFMINFENGDAITIDRSERNKLKEILGE